MRRATATCLMILLCPLLARADEGMWLFNDFPSDLVKSRYGFAPDARWLEKARLASVRLAGGCSGSFVSPEGLVLTNHHCASSCIHQVSTPEKDYMETGFLAASRDQEVKCPEIEVNVLVEIRDVTDRLAQATAGKEGGAFSEAQKAEMTRIEAECAQNGAWRCDVVTLFHGGAYHLYRYQRYQDVRLVFAPEFRIAFFGGDPDNFTFPRYDLDMAMLRVYQDGKPLRSPAWFRFSNKAPREGDLTFVSGHPGRTQRLLTVAELEFLRDVAYPTRLLRLAELRGLLTQYGRRSPEARREARENLFFVENSYKAVLGMWRALLDPALMRRKADLEAALRLFIQDPEKARAWDAIAESQQRYRDFFDAHMLLEQGWAFPGDLFPIARMLVRGAAERQKPDDQRLREYTEAALPSLTQRLFSTAPVPLAMEEELLAFGLTKLREILTMDDPVVRQVLGDRSPERLAAEVVQGTRLADLEVRKALWEGGPEAIQASTDPMIRLAIRVDEAARAVRKRYEEQVEAVVRQHSATVARAHFQAATGKTWPDATFTLRLSFGTVQSFRERGRTVPPVTFLEGAFQRHTGEDPYALPASWLAAASRLNRKTSMNVATTNDIVGGNSGSPLFNKNLELVGLIFDGNLPSLGGAFWFDEASNRAVAVTSQAILEALKKVYRADRLVRELSR
ncbi:MAG TPA: S46 family peptidase [Myxococcota bacterium]|nr:S46 family peptidase [Myxococcota bacterium]HQK49569.1 S46 family peptidase [Myxococcota bacterium]